MNRRVLAGDLVMLRTVDDRWIGPYVALTDARVDYENAFRRSTWESVSVQPDGYDHPINWPARDVKVAG